HVAFVSSAQYLPEAAPGAPNVYQWDDGVLSLAGILPDGTVPPGGSEVIAQSTAAVFPNYRRAMSVDGTRLLFAASLGGNRQLFQRIGGARTVLISESELTPPDPFADPSSVRLRAATPDGRNVFFTTDTGLVDADTNGDTDLYRWTDSADPTVDANLTKITPNGFAGQVVGVSDDGERVYYHTTGNDIVVWDHGSTTVISSGMIEIPGPVIERLGVDEWGPGYGRVSPDGRYFAFGTRASTGVPGNDTGPTGEVTNGHREMYLYTIGVGLQCVSCPAGEATSDATVSPTVTDAVISYTVPGIRPRFLSDGGRVFFSTADALVPEDVNGVADAYDYDPSTGRASLLSTGKGSDPANFVDASVTGDDVFIVTRQRLVKSDRDGLVDLYDVRIGDALPDVFEEPTPSCEGEACQPPPSSTPVESLLGTLAFDDGGAGGGTPAGLTARKRLVLHGTTGSLRVRLSAPGTLRWSGKGLRSGRTKRSRSGTVVLQLRLGRRARAHLRTSGLYRTSVRLIFSSSSGDVSRTTRVTFKAATKKGR
ncbi:MAG TPA: hypothetical protein VFS37_04480, partial [Conexibacter sp.]|nr:hypothetical protein [Conexibacter sp.]